MFTGFTERQMNRIAQKLGYSGPMDKFDEFLASNPAAQMKFDGLNKKIQMRMRVGGAVRKFQEGGDNLARTRMPTVDVDFDLKSLGNEISPASVPVTQPTQPMPAQFTPTYQFSEQTTPAPGDTISDVASARMLTPGLPTGGTTIAQTTPVEPGQFMDPRIAELEGTPAAPVTQAQTAVSTIPTATTAATTQAQTVADKTEEALAKTTPATGTVSQQMEAAQIDATQTEVGTVPAAQIAQAVKVDQPQSRTLQAGELVDGVANAQQAATFTEQVQAAQADPSSAATVKGQLDNLMADFQGGNTPSWAAGALRNATAQMAARGLGASSLAGQALVQAAMEASLPIAQADAQISTQFELSNLSNKQARAMLAAQQRAQFMGQEFDQEFQARVANASKISEIANINFNAEQQIALENARLAQTVDLENLSNRQALVLAESAQIANLESANLNNRQQSALQNAQAFLQMDLTNLSNEQQVEMFNAQSRIQSLMSDQAAVNASRQFNASSQNQTDQFFANLQSSISQFNAGQQNAQNQFNADQSNVIGRFNAELENQRDQFNAQNQLVVEQANATWRRQIATADTAAVNTANQLNAQAILNMSNLAYSNLWQEYRDLMEWAWTSTESERERDSAIAVAKIAADASKYGSDKKEDSANSAAWGEFVFSMIKGW